MGEGDTRAMRWFQENCTGFDREYGLVPMNFSEMGLAGAQRSLFKMKLNEILGLMKRMEIADMEKERKR